MYMLWFTLKYISYVDNISDYILPYENEGRINSLLCHMTKMQQMCFDEFIILFQYFKENFVYVNIHEFYRKTLLK